MFIYILWMFPLNNIEFLTKKLRHQYLSIVTSTTYYKLNEIVIENGKRPSQAREIK